MYMFNFYQFFKERMDKTNKKIIFTINLIT